jgi:putative DNA primase/helicase
LVTTITGSVVPPEAASHAIVLWAIQHIPLQRGDDHAAAGAQVPQKPCGKSTLLTIIGSLAARAIATANISAAALYRTVEQAQPTLLVDEADSFLKDNEELRGVLNAGLCAAGR